MTEKETWDKAYKRIFELYACLDQGFQFVFLL